MAFERTYAHTVLIGLDDFGAAVFLGRNDCTISTACDLVRKMDSGNKAARDIVMLTFAFHNWQIVALRRIGAALEKIQPGHCNGARLADIARGQSMAGVLASVAG